MKRVFVTFADTWRTSGRRIEQEVKELAFFDEIHVYDEHDLDRPFIKRFRVSKLVRGCGYYAWKPYLVKREVARLKDGDFLLYCDAGCHLNAAASARFLEYVEMTRKSSSKMLAVSESYPEKDWTKGDVFDYFGVRNVPEVTESEQIMSGHLFLEVCDASRHFVECWMKAVEDDPSLIDDSPSKSPNFPGFRENRHDQSIFSILCKTLGVATLPKSETHAPFGPDGKRDWTQMVDKPIWDGRWREIYLWARALRKIYAYFGKHFRYG